jgi:PAS domain S-box-containing protein
MDPAAENLPRVILGTDLLTGLPSGALLVVDGAIAHANPRAAEILARSAESLVGLSPHEALHSSLDCPGACALDEALTDPPSEPTYSFSNFGTLDGETRRVKWAAHRFDDTIDLVVFEEAFERSLIEVDRTRLFETQAIAQIGSWEWHTGPNQVLWTPELFRIFGLDRADFEGTYESYLEHVHPDDKERVVKVIESAFSEREPFDFEHRIVRPDGETRYLSSSGRVFVGYTGDVERMSGTCQDVTERKLYEHALKEREGELRLILDQMPIILWTFDRDLRHTSAMGAPLEALGTDAAALRGRHLFDIEGTDDPTHPNNAAHLKALRGVSASFDAERNGRTFRSRIDPLRDADGEVIGVLGIALDVTEEIRAEQELREAHENYRSLIEAIPAISYIETIRGKARSLFVSPQIKDIMGFSPEEIRPHLWASQLHPDDRDSVTEKRRDAYRRGEAFEEEYRILTRDGKTLWVRDQAVFVRDEEGHAIFVQGIMYDITERKRLEDQLVQSHKMDALGRLTGGIAHDFNNLLTAILGNCYLALDGDGDLRSIRAVIEEIKETADLGADLVSQLLGFSRRNPVEAGIIDLRDLVASTKSLLRRIIGEDIVLQTKSSESPLHVRVDSGQITQVILNLAINAREAMPGGGRLQIEVLHSSDAEDGDIRLDSDLVAPVGPHAVLRVSDSGGGMDERTRASLFEPFFTTKERGSRSGTGLGLSIVYGIVNRAKGHITVDSAPGAGSRISIHLPLELALQDDMVPSETPVTQRGTGSVLVVEDDDRVRSIASQMLQRMGYDVLEASGGDEAIKLAQGRSIDILVTDVVMPGMDGKRLAELMSIQNPDLRIVFMSGYPEEIWGEGSPPTGAAFIQKPFRREDLMEKLRTVQTKAI